MAVENNSLMYQSLFCVVFYHKSFAPVVTQRLRSDEVYTEARYVYTERGQSYIPISIA